jgi:predicted molibdopterin-dependent oxidoreductase YjgC
MRKGCVWMPLHFPDQNTNYLTNDIGDTVTQTAEYKVCAVKVERIEAAAK